MNILKTGLMASALILSSNVNATLVSTTYSTNKIIYTYLAPGAVDTYGLGINNFNSNSNVSVNYTYDNDIGNATKVSSGTLESDYDFHAPPYSASIAIDGAYAFNSTWSLITLTNNAITPPGSAIPQYWIDAGFPSALPGPTDALWMGGYSEDHTFNPAHSGLEFAIDFIDLSGTWLTSTDVIPAAAPDIATIDFAVLTIRQYENGTLQFEAAGIIANNLSTVPVPAAAWLFGSGLIGLFGFARRKNFPPQKNS